LDEWFFDKIDRARKIKIKMIASLKESEPSQHDEPAESTDQFAA
jgi:hypothetical protein